MRLSDRSLPVFNSAAALMQHYRDVRSRLPQYERNKPAVVILPPPELPPEPPPPPPPPPPAPPEPKKVRAVPHKFDERGKFLCVCDAVAERLGVPTDMILSPTRKRYIVRARQVVCYVCVENLKWGLSRTARQLKRDHTTILHSVFAVRERRAQDQYFAAAVRDIEADAAERLGLSLPTPRRDDMIDAPDGEPDAKP